LTGQIDYGLFDQLPVK